MKKAKVVKNRSIVAFNPQARELRQWLKRATIIRNKNETNWLKNINL